MKTSSLDQSPKQSDRIVVATVDTVTPTGKGDHHGTEVELQDVKLRVLETIKGDPEPALTLRHMRVLPTGRMVANGFVFPRFVPGTSYLLFLKRNDAGRWALLNEEDHLVEIAAATLQPNAPRTAPVERIIAILEQKLSACTDDCNPTIWLLHRSSLYRSRLTAAPARQAFVDQLLRITHSSTDDNSLLAAYTVLGEMHEASVLPALIARICAPQGSDTRHLQVNTVGWLQGFPDAQQRSALKQVAHSAKDKDTRAEALRRLDSLRTNR